MTRPWNCLLLAGFASTVVGCANGYSASYKGAGEAASAMAFGREAEAKFEELSATNVSPAALSGVRIFLDSVPGELAVDGTTIGVKEGAGELVGSVRIIATVSQPSPEEVLPVLQRAALAAGADLAYCPAEGMAWRCYLVRTPAGTARPAPAAPTP